MATGRQKSRLAGVIFDMDGVLCDSEPFICAAACRMFLERHGVPVQPEDFRPFVGAGENRYLGGVAEQYGVTLALEADKARTYAIYLEIIRGRLRPLPGVREFIAACRQRGLKLAVATSADEVKLKGNLAEIGLPCATFDVCVHGLQAERKKPFPDLFQLAAKGLGLDNAECLVVEDAPNGIQAAKAAGSPCLGLTTSFPEHVLRAAGADFVAANLAEGTERVLD